MESKRIRTAAYCRVSTEREEQEGSFQQQVLYYTTLIQSNPKMEFAGIYGDKGKSGLVAGNRPGLQRLLEDCKNGKIGLILTKSVSRFSRNMSDLVTMIRELKRYGVNVQFERENIDTRANNTDFVMQIFAAIAEEESRSISQHSILAHEQYAREGRPFGTIAFGYRNAGNHRWVIDEEQAPVVRKAFQMASQGECYATIRNELNKMEARGCTWSQERLKRMLTNLVYKGDYFSHASICIIPGKKVKNIGYRDRYYIEDHHEPIIAPELFDKVQNIIKSGILNSYHCLNDDDNLLLESLNEQISDEENLTQIRSEKHERFCGGTAPFGYVRIGGKLEKEPLTASAVQQMFIKAMEGNRITAIASWLESEGIPSPRRSSRWSDNTVRDILKNDVYVDDLIGREFYEEVQKRFHPRAEKGEREPGAYHRLVLCGCCGRAMAFHGTGGKDRRKTAIYACKYHTGANPKGQPLDRMPRIDVGTLEAEVQRQSHQCDQRRHREPRSITVYPDGRIEVQY